MPVLCSKAQPGTCCKEDHTGHPAWKYSRTNVFVGSSCADARMAYCKSKGSFGSKYCPAELQGRFPNTPPAQVVYRQSATPLQSRRNILRDTQRNRDRDFNEQNSDFPSGATAPSGEGGSTPRGVQEESTKPDTLAQLCQYFKWMNFISDDCHVQVVAGIAGIAVAGILLSKVIR